MTGIFKPRPLALSIACLCAQTAVAEPAPYPLVAEHLVVASGKTPKESTTLTADRIFGQTDRSTRAEGNVEAVQGNIRAYADRMTYYPLEDVIEAEGKVKLLQRGDTLQGSYMRLKMGAQEGYFDDAVFQFMRSIAVSQRENTPSLSLMQPLPALPPRQSAAYGDARRIHFEGENHYRIENGRYSTCTPDRLDWFAKSEEIKLDYDLSAGEAKNATVYFKDTPILYAPWLGFPLNNQRKSGFLAPSFASSTRTGFDLSIPFYWNLAPNYDATITPRLMTKRGMQLGAEARHTDWHSDSEVQFEFLKDRQFDDRRYVYNLRHRQNLGRGFSAFLDWNGVSDDEYFTDLSSRVVDTAQRQLPRHFILGYNRAWWNASLETLRYQTLNPGGDEVISQPYLITPRLSFNARLPEWKGIELQMQGQYTRFTHPDLEDGRRLVMYPQLTYHFVRPGYYIRPKFGVHATTYRMDERDNPAYSKSLSRVLPVFSLDMGMTFERDARLAGVDWLQTLEPRLYYLNIRNKDQSEYPLFDTGLSDFNFGQIFSENRFSGYDRVNNANQLTAALTTRLLDPKSGAERVRAMIGQRYYFTHLKIGLPGEELKKDRYSEFLAAFSGQVAPHTYVDTALEYNFNSDEASRFSLAARYQPTHGQVISAAFRYNRASESLYAFRDTMRQIDLAAQWRLSNRWHAVGRYNYAFDSSRLVEGIAGVEYNAGCWVARFVVQRLETTAGDPNTSTFFQLELNDFGQIGSNPLQMLRRSIPGYRKINELPSGSLLTDD